MAPVQNIDFICGVLEAISNLVFLNTK